jgi:hypothetical protein
MRALVFAACDQAELVTRAAQLRRREQLRRTRYARIAHELAEEVDDGSSELFADVSSSDGSFVDAVTVHHGDLDQVARVLARAPITWLTIGRLEEADAGRILAALAQLPLAGIRTLFLDRESPPDVELGALAAALPNLRRLVSHRPLRLDELAAFGHHARLEIVDLESPTDALVHALATSPLAPQLRRIVLENWGPQRPGLADPLQVFTGCFPRATEIVLQFVALQDGPPRTGLVLPASLTITEPVPAALRAPLVAALGPVRQLDAASLAADAAALAAIARTAPDLRRLTVPGHLANSELVRTGQLQQLVTVGATDRSALVALAREPGAAALRSICVRDGLHLDDEVVAAVARSPHLTALRQLKLGTNRSNARVEPILALPSLVEVELSGPPPATVDAHPTLVQSRFAERSHLADP